MQLRLTLLAGGQRDDVVLTVDAAALVADVTERIRTSHPRVELPQTGALGLTVNPGSTMERVVAPETPMTDAGIRSGDVVSLTAARPAASTQRAPVATLHLIAGPGAPATYPLHRGTNVIGRDRTCDVRLADPLVSKRHAKINVTDHVEIIDDSSANGIVISDQVVDRAVLRPGDVATLGETVVSVTVHTTQAADERAGDPQIAFNRSPRLAPTYDGVKLRAPEPPQPPTPQRFPIVTLVAPIVMAGMIYAVTQNATSILFVALSPLMMVGAYFENRIASRKANEQAIAQYRSALTDLSVQLQYAQDLERTGRRREHPAADEVTEAVDRLSPMVWTRRPEHGAFLQLRLGLGTQRSRNEVELPTSNRTTPELWRELQDVVARFSLIDRVPVVADLRQCGNVGVAGPDADAAGAMRGVIAQFVGLHSPSELTLVGIAASAASWDFLKWLPHVGSDFSPLGCNHLASNSTEANLLVSEVEALIDARLAEPEQRDRPILPVVALFVHDDAPVERARLVQIAERGPGAGVFVAWCASSEERLPAACRAFVSVDHGTGRGRAGFVTGGEEVRDLEVEPISSDDMVRFARRLSPVADSGARREDESDLPRSVSFLALAGRSLGGDTEAIADLWRESNSLPATGGGPRRKRDNSLRAIVGQGATGPLHLDLRSHGPHALVGGTTGAGKSEFLQSWILGMATMHSPARVTFLFVDYKGGAAFADCVNLPHSVGLVTDLSPHLVRRALTSLNAELRHREHILNAKKAKDLLELERRNDPDAPPSLVIVVDEFAALVAEVPEFVDGVVNVAQRGRSLGLHLILATQRPAGVIKDNLRANTNLRVALRMADESDSTDVIGGPQAAAFDPSLPGRAIAKTGPARLTAFQSAYAGGWTSDEPPRPDISITGLRFGIGEAWEEPDVELATVDERGPNDIRRVVDTIGRAASALAIPAPRRPWLPELASSYRLEVLPSPRTDRELVFGVQDDPEAQAQPEVAFLPDRDGNMAVYGSGGSGKTTFLRSIAVAAAFAPARGGPCWVYGLEFGSRGLQMLETLPHVGSVINGDDHERLTRLLRWLTETIDDRVERFAAAAVATLGEYRTRADRPDEARIIVLVDGIGSFRQAYEGGERNRWWETFQRIAADGRAVGVHVVLSADRPGAVSSSLASAIQRRVVLRLATEMDYALLDTPADAFTATTPAGRGFVDGNEVQIAVLGGDPNVSRQASELERLARSMERAGVSHAPAIERLSDRVPLSELPVAVGAEPTLGLWDETLAPVAFAPTGTFLIAGPPQSGKTTTLATMVVSLRRHRPDVSLVYLGQRRSPLSSLIPWGASATSTADIDVLARELALKLVDDPTVCQVLVIEAVGELLNTEADLSVQDLIKVCRANDRFVIAEGETGSLTGSWPLLQAVKAGRSGVVLQPDQLDGDMLFKTPFPRTNRAEFPPGRGLLVHSGRWRRVQVALPE